MQMLPDRLTYPLPRSNMGIVLTLWPTDPASDSPADVAAVELTWQRGETLFFDAILKGHYPPAVYDLVGDNMPKMYAGDMALFTPKLYYLGVNFYLHNLV